MNLSVLRRMALPLLIGTMACVSGRFASHAEEAAPKKPPIPPIVSLSVQPASLTLEDARDARSLIVTGKTAAGYSVDLSPVATFKPNSKNISVDISGYVHPVKA